MLTVTTIALGGSRQTMVEGLEGAAQQHQGAGGDSRQPDRDVGGQQVFVFTGGDRTLIRYSIGRVVGDQVADLSVTCAKGALSVLTKAERDELIESVLATVVRKE